MFFPCLAVLSFSEWPRAKVVMPGCRSPSEATFLNLNGWRYLGRVAPTQIYVGSLIGNSNVSTSIHMTRKTVCSGERTKNVVPITIAID